MLRLSKSLNLHSNSLIYPILQISKLRLPQWSLSNVLGTLDFKDSEMGLGVLLVEDHSFSPGVILTHVSMCVVLSEISEDIFDLHNWGKKMLLASKPRMIRPKMSVVPRLRNALGENPPPQRPTFGALAIQIAHEYSVRGGSVPPGGLEAGPTQLG